MGKLLSEIANQLNENSKKIQLIYAFNGTGKTRLSREFKSFMLSKMDENSDGEPLDEFNRNVLYYNAFTEDLFYWDNDLTNDVEIKLKIHPNKFTEWILVKQGQDQNIIDNFQYFSNNKLTPKFNQEYFIKDSEGNDEKINAFTEVAFAYERGNEEAADNIKISKGEESNFIWSLFFSLFEQVIDILNVPEPEDRETNQFDKLEYVFIDDPVSSLDETHLIRLAVYLSELIKSSQSELKFIITTHNPLFYNVLCSEFGRSDKRFNYKANHFKKYSFEKHEDGTFSLNKQDTDSSFSYHLYLMREIENAVKSGEVRKYHFNYLRNILEKTATFLGYGSWVDILPKDANGRANPYEKRMLDLSSHSKFAGEEIKELSDDDKRVLAYLVKEISDKYKFKKAEAILEDNND